MVRIKKWVLIAICQQQELRAMAHWGTEETSPEFIKTLKNWERRKQCLEKS